MTYINKRSNTILDISIMNTNYYQNSQETTKHKVCG